MRRALAGLLAAAALGAAGCSGGGPAPPAVRAEAPSPTTTTATPSVTVSPSPSPSPTASPSTPTPHATATTATTTTTAAPRPATVTVRNAGHARQVVLVTAGGYGTSYATVQALTRTANGWVRTYGPWPARIGRDGLAPPGEKREGDGRTPSGSYPVPFLFGREPDPGVRLEYRRVTPGIVWVDDPGDPAYNEWVDTAQTGTSPRGEHMYGYPEYDYGAVVGYNLGRVPGRGSAIFLHVSSGRSTAGCVALPTGELLRVLRWLDPAAAPRFVIGVASTVTG